MSLDRRSSTEPLPAGHRWRWPRSRWSCSRVFFLYPVAGMVARGLLARRAFDPGAVLEVLGRPRVHRVLWFTAVVGRRCATAVSVLAGLPVAFVLHRLRFPGRDLLRALVVVPFVLPTVVVGVAFRQLIAPSGPLGGLGLDGTAAAIVAALVFFNISVVVRTVGSFWEAPRPAARGGRGGAGREPAGRCSRTVTLPALLPGHRVGGQRRLPVLRDRVRRRADLGGLRYANVETEIYLLTTQELDLTGGRGAVGAAAAGDHRAARALCPGTTHARRRSTAAPGATPRPRRAHLAVLGWTAVVRGLPDGPARLAGGRLAAARGQLGAAELPRPGHAPARATRCSCRPPRGSRTR